MSSITNTPRIEIVIPARTVRAMMLGLLMLTLWFVQYGSFDESGSALYDRVVGPLQWIDLIIFSVLGFHAVLWAKSKRALPRLPREIAKPALVFIAATVISMLYGFTHGGEHLFYDSRGIIRGIAVAICCSYWISSERTLVSVVRLFAFMFSVRIIFLYVLYLLGQSGGYGDVAVVRTTYHDGPTLSTCVLLGIMSLRFHREDVPAARTFWVIAGFVSYTFALLSMRRGIWAQLVVATLLLVIIDGRHRKRILTFFGVAVVVMFLAFGSAVVERVKSFDFTSNDLRYASTNIDHVLELYDAALALRGHYVTGIGLGRMFDTPDIAHWKVESPLVHNAILHVWLFYGLLGLMAYLWYHGQLFRWMHRRSKATSGPAKALFQVSLAYFIGQAFPTLFFNPWPYAETQLTLVTGFLLGCMFTYDAVCKAQTDQPKLAQAAA